jgi:hypothetical protein
MLPGIILFNNMNSPQPLSASPTLYKHLVIVEINKLLIHIKLEIKKYFLYMFHILIFRSGVLAEKDD